MDLQNLPSHLFATILSTHLTLKELAILDSAITNKSFRKFYLHTLLQEKPSWPSIPAVTRKKTQADDAIVRWINARNVRVRQMLVNTSGGAPTKILQYELLHCAESLHINEDEDIDPVLRYPDTQSYSHKLLKFLPPVCSNVDCIKYEGATTPDTYAQLSCQFPGLTCMEFVSEKIESCDEWKQFLQQSKIRSLKVCTSYANEAGGIVSDIMKYATRLREFDLEGLEVKMVTPSMIDSLIARCHKLTRLKLGKIPRTRHMMSSLETLMMRAKNMESLSLEIDFPISEEFIYLITQNLPYLTELSIHCEWTETRVLDLAADIISKKYPKLRKLDIGVHPWNVAVPIDSLTELESISLQVQPQNVDRVIRLLRRCDRLSMITLHLGLGNASTLLDSFLQLLPYCARIKSFGRAIAGINPQRLWLIANYCPSLRDLQLVALEHYELKDLVYLLNKCTKMQRLDFLFGKQLSPVLQSLRQRFPGMEITVSDQQYDPKTWYF